MINKKNNKTVYIIILLVIAVILAIIICILHIIDTLKQNEIIPSQNQEIIVQVKENPKDYTIEEILQAHECNVISYSIEHDEKQYYKIYLKFRYPLYKSGVSQEEYFNNIVDDLTEKIGISFNLVDQSRDIDIFVDPENDIYTINGIEDYFENNSYVKVNSHTTTKAIQTTRSSIKLNRIINNSWNRHNLNLDEEPEEIEKEWIYYYGYKINYSDININYIIFDKEYEEEIISGIKVGEEFSKIKQILGKPMYENSKDMIGYKTINGYVFFYEDYIALYPCMEYTNINLEKNIMEYYNQEYDGYRTNFILDIKDNYTDFKSEIIEDGVKLYSVTRGIDLYLYDDKTMEIEIYDNYNIGSQLRKLAEINKIKLNYDMDSVYLYETQRISK